MEPTDSLVQATDQECKQVTGLEYVQEYVEFLFAGALFSETSVKRISAADRMTNNPGQIPSGCFGYRYFARVLTELDNGKTHFGDAYDFSPMYYFGDVLTYPQINQRNLIDCGKYDILLANMRNNDWDKVVETTAGNFQPLEQNDVVYKQDSEGNHQVIHP